MQLGARLLRIFSNQSLGSQHVLNFYRMFVPDVLHEFELSVWKATFTHLLRILYACGGDAVQELNVRFRQVPRFGRDTIRKFSNNVSAMKQMAARDFEDILQCSIPVFEGLVPDYDNIILNLLYDLATWHAYAKLRLHTEHSLDDMDHATTLLGRSLRKFKSTVCSAFITKELPHETAARGRRKANLVKKKAAAGGESGGKGKAKASVGSKQKFFNLNTYKVHSLGHYVPKIRLFGTTDSYSTQVGELEHRRVKQFYARTNKSRYVRQVAKHERRERLVKTVETRVRRLQEKKAPSSQKNQQPVQSATAQTISEDRSDYFDVYRWMKENSNDPAVHRFLPKLKHHLLAIILDRRDATFSEDECASLEILNDHLYQHKVMDIEYTSYDMRQCQDTINVRTHSDVMVLANEKDPDAHVYWYARVIGIFHARVSYRRMLMDIPFLWVRWLGLDTDRPFGPTSKRLPKVGYMLSDDPNAISFLNPGFVLCAVHLIPAFSLGRRMDLLAPSIARRPEEKDADWHRYCVNIFVDRDMFSRYIPGFAVGHHHIHAAKHTTQDHSDSSNEESGASSDSSVIIMVSDSELDETVIDDRDEEDDDDRASEMDDYGYRSSNSQDEEEIEGEGEVEESQWEDDHGQEYVDQDTDTLRTEGYAHL
ncbi:hypothetical protein PM082_022368 [Marasmius tenuissimus]|nr:hypothetical protein PM082_022368 [Marasmius tenuissimus]